MNYRVLQLAVAAVYIFGCVALGFGAGQFGVMLLGAEAGFFSHLLLMLALLPVPAICLALGHVELQTKIKEIFGPKEVDQSEA